MTNSQNGDTGSGWNIYSPEQAQRFYAAVDLAWEENLAYDNEKKAFAVWGGAVLTLNNLQDTRVKEAKDKFDECHELLDIYKQAVGILMPPREAFPEYTKAATQPL